MRRRRRAACGSTLANLDVYYFAPQKGLGSDGGLWLAALSPAAIERVERIAACDRWVPASLDLGIALDNSRKDQTYNTPAATIFLAAEQVEWINGNGGLEWSATRCDRSAEIIYSWAERSAFATPFVGKRGRHPQPRGRDDRSRRIHRRDHGLGHSAQQRDRRHGLVPQAGAEPAAHRPVPGHRPRRRDGAHRLH